MASLAVAAAMGADPLLQPRIAAAVVRLAVIVLAAGDTPPAEASLDEQIRFNRRRSYALSVTDDVPAFTVKAQWALACWDGSTLADDYAVGGADAVTDEAIITTLAGVWSTVGGTM